MAHLVASMANAPPPEVREAAGLHVVGHSVGLVLVPDDPAGTYSFRANADGTTTELAGWGWAGPTVDAANLVNPPANLLAVHTVAVEPGDDGALGALVGLRTVVEEHVERYAGCLVWVGGGLPDEVARWVAGGCLPPDEVGVPTGEELRTAAQVDLVGGPVKVFAERGGAGYRQSYGRLDRPTVPAVDTTAAEP